MYSRLCKAIELETRNEKKENYTLGKSPLELLRIIMYATKSQELKGMKEQAYNELKQIIKGNRMSYKNSKLPNEIPFEEKRVNLAVNLTRTESDMALRNACKMFIESDVISERDIAMLELFTQIVKEKFEMFDLQVYKDRYFKEIEK